MKGCCPFHNEKTPSFYVNEEKGFYHCFGCGVHGDAISFLMEQDGLSFLDAVKWLAAEAGLELPPLEHSDPEARTRAGLHDLLAAASEWFRAQLRSGSGAAARDYLAERKVSPMLADQFGVGFAPDSRDALSKALKSRIEQLEPDQLLAAGLTGESEGRKYDRFRGRLMFPIHDPRGRVVGFGGRILVQGEPKYLNSPEGPVFHKGRLLYNYHRAAPVARKSGQLIVVEGYMDVLALAGAGIPEAVAPLGTALTEEQIQLCWRASDSPILSFDGDNAGHRAAARAALRVLPMLVPGKSARVMTLPQGLDPDDFVKQRGAAAYRTSASKAKLLSEFVYENEERTADLNSPEGRSQFMRNLKDISSTIVNFEVQKEFFLEWRGRAIRSFTADQRRRGQWKDPRQTSRELRVEASILQAPNRIVEAKILASFARRTNLHEIEDLVERIADLNLYYPALYAAFFELRDGKDVEAIRLRGVVELLPREMPYLDFRRLAQVILGSLREIGDLREEWKQLRSRYETDFDAAYGDQRHIAERAFRVRERLLNIASEVADPRTIASAAA
jgi:DNA primase